MFAMSQGGSVRRANISPEKISGLEAGGVPLEGIEWHRRRRRVNGPRPCSMRGASKGRACSRGWSARRRNIERTLGKACEIRAVSRRVSGCECPPVAQTSGHSAEAAAFLEEHPIIRPLDDYARLVAWAFIERRSASSLREGFARHGSGVRAAAERTQPRRRRPPRL